MLILFQLGALQGAIGWIMVASGLTGDAIYVKPAKLALHFVFALGLLAYTFWFALELLVPKEKIVFNTKIHKLTIGILAVLLVQLVYGAFMAGHKAATAAPTWPDINGSIIPPNMFGQEGGLLDLIDNRITIHFIHRGLAYILLAMVLWQTSQLFKSKATADLKISSWLPAFLVSFQLALGILSVLSSTEIIPNQWGLFEWMAQLHQLIAMALLLSQVWLLYIVRRQPAL
jgi:cytochrome c oxidase assembly protein subunit 15